MKLIAKIDWMIDGESLGIKTDEFDKIPIDMDYVESNEESVTEWVENEIASKYGVSLVANKDFVIMNLENIIGDLKYMEYEDKTDPGFFD